MEEFLETLTCCFVDFSAGNAEVWRLRPRSVFDLRSGHFVAEVFRDDLSDGFVV